MRSTISGFTAMALLGAVCWFGPLAAADVPNDTALQGRLLDDAGEAIPGPVDIGIRVFATLSGGSPLYQELHGNVPLSDGVFSVVMGTGSFTSGTYDASTFAAANRYLELQIEEEVLEPRLPFSSVAYAFQAQNSESVGGLEAGDLVTGVSAGAGLVGGGAGGSVTLGVNPSEVQARVDEGCPAGQYLRAIAEDGSVTCGVDEGGDITGVTAAAGLSGGGSAGDVPIAVDFDQTQARVTGACGAGNYVRAVDANGTVTCQADGEGVTSVLAGNGITVSSGDTSPRISVENKEMAPLTCAGEDASRSIGFHHFCALASHSGTGDCLIRSVGGGEWSLEADCGATESASCSSVCF